MRTKLGSEVLPSLSLWMEDLLVAELDLRKYWDSENCFDEESW